MKYLVEIKYKFPNENQVFRKQFFTYFSHVGNITGNEIILDLSHSDYIPVTRFSFIEIDVPQVEFIFDDASSYSVDICNITNILKQSPHAYK